MTGATHAPKSRVPERAPAQAPKAKGKAPARRPEGTAGLAVVGNQEVQRLAARGGLSTPGPAGAGAPPPRRGLGRPPPPGPGQPWAPASGPVLAWNPVVQSKCAACEAQARESSEGLAAAASADDLVQRWDCGEYTEPTCTAGAEAGAEQPVQSEPVQAKCAACEAEERQAAEAPGTVLSHETPIQRWDCGEYTEPTCTAGEAGSEPVQSRPADPQPGSGPDRSEPVQQATVQPRCAACASADRAPPQRAAPRPLGPRAIQREARRGLQEASLPLPHGERIQAAFGRHDVSGVRAGVGGSAETASRRIGALAFASGDRIAFRESPDLHLAAHEAAHVVQQREGLRLPGNVGRARDPWERHAERVADAVVAGRSAEPLLDQVAGPGGARSGGSPAGPASAEPPVQRQIVTPATRLFEPAPTAPALPQAGGEPGGGPPGAGGGAPAEPGAGEQGDALAAAEGGDTEAPPEGITVGGAAPGGAGGGAGTPSEAGGPAAPGAAPPAPEGGGLNAPCYNVDPPPRPADTPEPTADAASGEAQAEPQVTFDAWVDTPDKCEAQAAVAQGAGQATTALGEAGGGGPAAASPAVAGAGGAAEPAPARAPAGGGRPPAAAGQGASAAPAAAPADAMSSPIGNAESGRDAAVADYQASLGTLDQAESRARVLAPGMAFFGPGLGGPQAEAATAQVRDFMDGAAGQIAAALAFARERVPGRLGGLAEATKASIRSAMEEEKAAIAARVAQARIQVMGAAAAARARIRAAHAVNLAVVEVATLAAHVALDAQYPTSQAQVDQKETKGLEDVNARFAKGRKRHEDKGPEYAGRAVARGQEHAHRYERCKVHPKTGVNYDDDGFWDGCLNVRRAKAQQDAACKTAAGYRTVFLRTANKKGYDLKDVRSQYRCAVIAGARQVNDTLDTTYERLSAGLESGRAQAVAGLAAARDQSLAGVDGALAAALTALAAQETSQRQAVNDAGYLNELAVEQLAHASAAGLARGIGAALDSLEGALAALRERLAAGGVPDPAVLGEALAGIERSLGGGMGSLLATMETGAAGAEGRIGAAGAAALAALRAVTAGNAAQSVQAESGFAGRVGTLATGASLALGAIAGRQLQQARQAATEGTASMKRAVAGFDEALASIGERVDAAIADSLGGLDRELKAKLAELDGQIAREAWKAAEKEQPAWVSVVAVVLIILVVIIATAISILTLGAGASLFAVILVGALVGAVSAGLIQVLNNWASGEALGQGVIQAMIMGAVGGAIGGALGFAGGALAAGAAQAGARVATQFAITLTADLVAEGLTQTVGYVAFGQQFNWQGFVMAGAMSGASFRAHPSGPRPAAGGAPEAPAVPRPSAPEAPAAARPGVPEAPSAPRPAGPEPPAAPRPPAPEPPTARPGAGEGGAPRPTSPKAGAETGAGARAGARRAAGQIALGAGAGLVVEGGIALATGEPLDPRRLASAVASGAGARASHAGIGPAGAPRREPTTRLGRAHAAVETRLQDLGGRLVGARPAAEAPAGGRPRAGAEPEPTPTPARASAEPETPPTPARAGTEPETPPTPARAGTEPETPPTPARADTEPQTAPRPQGIDQETAAALAGPANRLADQDLIDATTTHARVGDTDHDLRISREGSEICTACDLTRRRLTEMIENLPPGPLRRRLEQLRTRVDGVETRLANGESGVNMVRDSARIAAEFRTLGEIHPSMGRSLESPQLRQTTIEGSEGAVVTSRHLHDLDADVALTRTVGAADFRSVPMREGDQAIYILRDRASGAVLKVGIAEGHLGRASQYANAGNKLGLSLELDVAIVTPRSGKSIRDIEASLRGRLSDEGHILPWDNTAGRLGRSDRGTPFVHPVGKDLMWDANGNLVQKGTGAPPPRTTRGRATPEEVADLMHQGLGNAEIAAIKGVPEPTVRRWKSTWRDRIDDALNRLRTADEVGEIGD